MQKLIRVHNEKPQAFNEDAITSMVATNVFGGPETTTSSIRAVLYFLLKTPTAMMKLQQEIDQTCHEHSWPRERPSRMRSSQVNGILAGCHSREHASVSCKRSAAFASISTGRNWKSMATVSLPGVQLTVYSWALHRNKKLFGEDAAEFRPERWLEQRRISRLASMLLFFSFGSGSRGCLGRNLAWMDGDAEGHRHHFQKS